MKKFSQEFRKNNPKIYNEELDEDRDIDEVDRQGVRGRPIF